MPLTPEIDSERLYELKLAQLTPEAREMHNALAECRNLAEKAVLVVTKFGLPGLGEFCRCSKANRKEFKAAAAALKAVGLIDEGTMLELAAPSKAKPPIPWRERQHKHMMERVKMLRAKGALATKG
jgi:hypothetical protein